MRINNNISEQANLEAAQGAVSAGKLQSTSSKTVSPPAVSQSTVDRVDVSETAATLNRMLDVDQAQREEKVAALTQLFRSGQFQVDAEALSHAILRDAEKNSTPGV